MKADSPQFGGDKGISFSAKGKQQEKKKRLPQHAGRFFPTSRDNLNNAAPAGTSREAIIEAGQRIALYFPVFRSIHFVVAYGRSCIAVQAYGFQTVGLPASGQIGFYLQQDYAIGIRLCPKRQPASAKRLDFKPPTGHLRQCNG
ncbi:hypothetical protein M3090_02815 [Bacteroides sp. ET71]|uniref:hypothetical protein n=1 Tax=Bacteroides sp. ET71 TaxID=2939421 RepID=UPI0020113600|nr:hypothetical protein [Bacteroides sp. ET71]MCL1615332.1 hypothetical protein [Bacteroides sp. ET71]